MANVGVYVDGNTTITLTDSFAAGMTKTDFAGGHSNGVVTITQNVGGGLGNTTITLTDPLDGMSKTDFTGGTSRGYTDDAWGGTTLSAEGRGNTYGAPTHFYPHWALGICGDADHSIPFNKIYIREFIELCPLEDSPNLGLTGCTANSYLSDLC